MSSLILIHTGRRYQYGGHHCQRAACRGYHVTHNIAIIVLAGPDKSALCLHNTGNRIINQCIEILDACCLKFLLVFLIIDILKNIFEIMVIDLRDRILCSKPQILLCIQCIVKTCLCKARDGLVCIVDTLNDTGTIKLLNRLTDLFAVCTGKY